MPRSALLPVYLLACAAAPALGVEYARSPNFVVMAEDAALAEAVLSRAEDCRRELAAEWLGTEPPAGVGPAMINVRLSQNEDRAFTWAAGQGSSRQYHRVWLTTSRERATGSTLKHELVHVLLATRYPSRLSPWVEEGIASRYDDADRLALRRRTIAWYAETNNWPSLAHVLEEQNITADELATYTVAGSLAEFLIGRKGRAEFLAFASDGGERGWEPALLRHYGIAGVDELQAKWQAWVSANVPDARSAR